MSRHTLRNLILLAAVLALGLLAYWKPGQEPLTPNVTLTGLNPAEITQIRVVRPDEPRLVLTKKGQSWFLDEPIAIEANPFRVSSLLDLAESTSHAQYPLPGKNAAEFGLDPPEVRLELDGQELAFGSTEPLNFRRYVRVGEILHLIDDVSLRDLKGHAATFVSLRLIPEGASVSELRLPELRLAHAADGAWSTEPAAPGVSADRLQALADEWTRARAIEVEHHAEQPEGDVISVVLAERADPLRFIVTRREPGLVLVRADLALAYHFPQAAAQRMLQLPSPPPTDEPTAD